MTEFKTGKILKNTGGFALTGLKNRRILKNITEKIVLQNV